MTRAFATDAIAECARRGHRWRFVRTWHAVGFDECERCGETQPIPASAELTAGLRKLLEAKDCFVRASLPK